MDPVRIALLGDIFVDLHAHGVSGLPEWGEDRTASAVHLLPGGSCANTARHLASITSNSFCVSLFSTLGDDELGRHFLRRVTEEALLHEPHSTLRLLPGVPQSCCLILSGVRRGPAVPGAPATAEADRAMVSCYSSTSRLSVPECSPALSRGRWDVLHLGGYFNCPRLHSDDLLRLCDRVHASGGIVSFDSQFDASERWEGEGGHLARLLPLVDVMLLSELEAGGIAGWRQGRGAAVDAEAAIGVQVRYPALPISPHPLPRPTPHPHTSPLPLRHAASASPRRSPACSPHLVQSPGAPTEEKPMMHGMGQQSAAATMENLVRRYPSSLIVIKRGGDGVSAGRGAERWELPAFATDVIDATGAGDAFNAGFLSRYAVNVNRTDVLAALRAGAAAGAAAVARSGACVVPLTEADLRGFIENGR